MFNQYFSVVPNEMYESYIHRQPMADAFKHGLSFLELETSAHMLPNLLNPPKLNL